MLPKQEILQKLTGIHSSRKTYYAELAFLIEEMKKKNKQLEVINQLTKIQISASWQEVSSYIAAQLSLLIPFDSFALTLVKGSTLSSYISTLEQPEWRCQTLVKPVKHPPALGLDQLENVMQAAFPAHRFTSVSLRSHLNQVLGFLTLLHHGKQKADAEEVALFRLIAEHVGVAIENIILFQDVCEKVGLEAQLVQSAKMAAIGEMAAGIAHELNSPLTAILGNAQLLMREAASGPLHPLMKDIYQCGVRCKKIIQNLLTFSRQEEYAFECLALNDLIDDVLGLIGYQLAVSGIEIQQKRSSSTLSFHGSRHQIEQVLINLLLNARDALNGREHPQIIIETFLLEEEAAWVGLSIRDNGAGIQPEHLPQIFQPFFTTKESAKGTGLGLSVSLGITESHGGRLFAESERNRYSKFTLLLPFKKPKEDADGEETRAGCG
ncbi:sensor histidine kinase [Brevibacillus sp. B_LB10_24]|uniref:sensor histidine kinase n=1 Tax=Brevibacillus sp. B_LB10_24 TaxID=3380645 RepID=UPI0038BD337C